MSGGVISVHFREKNMGIYLLTVRLIGMLIWVYLSLTEYNRSYLFVLSTQDAIMMSQF